MQRCGRSLTQVPSGQHRYAVAHLLVALDITSVFSFVAQHFFASTVALVDGCVGDNDQNDRSLGCSRVDRNTCDIPMAERASLSTATNSSL